MPLPPLPSPPIPADGRRGEGGGVAGSYWRRGEGKSGRTSATRESGGARGRPLRRAAEVAAEVGVARVGVGSRRREPMDSLW